MMSPMSPLVRPCRITYRLTTTGTKTNFRLPFLAGFYAWTMISGGAGSGATHTSYADPSERGGNGDMRSSGYAFRNINNGQITSMIVGAKGVGGTLTNNSDIAAQRGKAGTVSSWTGSGITTTSAASTGGRCAFEATGLSPTQLAAPYTVYFDTRSLATGGWLTYLGCVHDGGSVVSTNAGRGAVGVTTPGVAGNDGNDGRADWYWYN